MNYSQLATWVTNDNHCEPALYLPTFWPNSTEAWLVVIEARFWLKHIDDKQEQFDNVVNSLPKESLFTMLDLVTRPPEGTLYTAIKEHLFMAHQLIHLQHEEKLFQMDSLGGYKHPSSSLK
jgi:hypothetical protein